MAKRTLEEIEKEIQQTKAELLDVHGTETEVYARIVGYYRAVKNWNKGKRDEFDSRKMFNVSTPNEYTFSTEKTATKLQEKVEHKSETAPEKSLFYELYTRDKCPNCPPVCNYMKSIIMNGTIIDVDTEEGLSHAARNGVFASPTVIFYNADGTEIHRSHSVEELEEFIRKVPVQVAS